MSNNADDEWQRKAESGEDLNSTDRDLAAYRELFRILRQQPPFKPTSIESAVILKIERARRRKMFLDHSWLVLGVLLVVVTGLAAVAISGFRIPLSNWQRDVMALGVFGALVIVVLNAIERRLLKR